MLSSDAIGLWKSFRRSRTQLRDRPETVRLHPGTGVHLHPGILFEIIPEHRSESSRNRVHLAPESPTKPYPNAEDVSQPFVTHNPARTRSATTGSGIEAPTRQRPLEGAGERNSQEPDRAETATGGRCCRVAGQRPDVAEAPPRRRNHVSQSRGNAVPRYAGACQFLTTHTQRRL